MVGKFRPQGADSRCGLGIVSDALGDAPAGVQDGRVVAAAERLADRMERVACQVAGELDRQVTGPGDLGSTVCGHEIGGS